LSYDNAVRHAVRTVKNPTDIDVAIEQYPNGDILLHVDHKSVKQLPKAKRGMFAGYLKELIDIIETHGGVRASVDMGGAYD